MGQFDDESEWFEAWFTGADFDDEGPEDSYCCPECGRLLDGEYCNYCGKLWREPTWH
jgi:hypothetical protein